MSFVKKNYQNVSKSPIVVNGPSTLITIQPGQIIELEVGIASRAAPYLQEVQQEVVSKPQILVEAPLSVAEVVEEETKEYDFSILDKSVSDLTEALESVEDVQYLFALLEAENSGKTRKTAVEAIENRIESL